jgi:hypothetical protein
MATRKISLDVKMGNQQPSACTERLAKVQRLEKQPYKLLLSLSHLSTILNDKVIKP